VAAVELSAEKEAEAQELLARIQTATQQDLLQLARLLVSTEPRTLFGPTEFAVRDLVLGVGAKAFELHLAEKKTATREPASSARTASKRPSSRVTGRKRR
jgi:hypothetical protein